MACDIFLRLDGIKGESKDKATGDHEGDIELLSWSFGMSNGGTSHGGGGGGAGKANVTDMSCTKYVDKASADLMQRALDLKPIKKAELWVRKAGGKALEYIKYEMADVLVTSVSTGGSGGEDQLTENITLNFAKIKFDYQEQKEDGSGSKAGEMSWDIQGNAKW